MNENAQWFYTRAGQQVGPVSFETIRQLAASGQLQPTDMTWFEGQPDWIPASLVPGLFPSGAQMSAGAPLPLNYSAPADVSMYAGFWQRFAAWFIDAIVCGVGGCCVGMPIGVMIAINSPMNSSAVRHQHWGGNLSTNMLSILVSWLYSAFLESSSQQATLGKMALRLKVTTLEGNRVSFAQATGRYFGKFLSGLILGIGYLMMLWSPRKQCLHDQLAGTLVVNKQV